ncbi:MAG: hypothetical protein WCK65_01385 [Rhodospirillaceae bacterium]
MRKPKVESPQPPQPTPKPPALNTPPGNGFMALLDGLLGSKAPIQLPGKLKFVMAKFGHFLVIGLMLLVLPGQLIGLGMRAAVLPFASMAGTDSSLKLALALATLLFLIVVMILALPGLQSRKVIGWQLLVLAIAINLIYGLLTGGLISPILGSMIWLYILFQLRRYYM